MTEEKIKEVMERFSMEAKRIYGTALRNVILYGSCARGDFDSDSDIDIMVLLDTPQESINEERKKMLDMFIVSKADTKEQLVNADYIYAIDISFDRQQSKRQKLEENYGYL